MTIRPDLSNRPRTCCANCGISLISPEASPAFMTFQATGMQYVLPVCSDCVVVEDAAAPTADTVSKG